MKTNQAHKICGDLNSKFDAPNPIAPHQYGVMRVHGQSHVVHFPTRTIYSDKPLTAIQEEAQATWRESIGEAVASK